MRRLWLYLALLLALLPSPAAAAERVAPGAGSGRFDVAVAPDFGALAWASVGFELPVVREQKREGWRLPRGLLSEEAPDPRLALRPWGAPRPGGGSADPAGSTPLCENLSYHSTAPPTVR